MQQHLTDYQDIHDGQAQVFTQCEYKISMRSKFHLTAEIFNKRNISFNINY